MILESLLVLAVLGVILVFFYKQAVREFRILQTDSLDKALGLLHERCPIVVLPAPTPGGLWTSADLKARPALSESAFAGMALKDAIQKSSVTLNSQSAELIAEKTGLSLWIQQQILPLLKTYAWWSPFLLSRTEVAIGAQGLRQTYGVTTMLFSTEHEIQVSLLNETANPYLPQVWQNKRLSKLTRDDAPLLPQIQFLDVIVRPGSALLLPPHWKVCWENREKGKPGLAVWAEFHHPVSWILRKASMRK